MTNEPCRIGPVGGWSAREWCSTHRAYADRPDTGKCNAVRPCDRHGCTEPAAWVYRVSFLDGVDDVASCQQHTREVRAMHGMNVLDVRAAS